MVLCVLFFFFKQKTAYEMRISDWSSDVCSSDLSRRGPLGRKPWFSAGFSLSPTRMEGPSGLWRPQGKHDRRSRCPGRSRNHGPPTSRLGLDRRRLCLLRLRPGRRRPAGAAHHPHLDQDRKSVLLVKSVYVLVDRGGRRIIKKQQNKKK